MRRLIFGLGAAALLAWPGLCGADGLAPRGVIELVVHDSKGAPVSGVTVTLMTSEAEGSTKLESKVTPRSGEATFRDVPQGTYSLRFELSGFFTTTLSEVPVELKAESPRLPAPLVVVLTAGPEWF